MKLYMEVTMDDYELPIIVADSVRELAEICHVSPKTISSCISHEKAGGKRTRYKKVVVEDNEK